jgi:hypothetical protein
MCTQATLVHMSNSEIWNNGEIKKIRTITCNF